MTQRAEFEQYIRENIFFFFKLAIQHCGDEHQAKEVLQLVIIKLWRLWQEKGPEVAKRSAYRALYTVTIDEYRRRTRRREVSIETDQTDFEKLPDADPEVDEEVRDAVAKLKLPLHRVIFLKYYGGLSNSEIAETLQIAKEQVSRDLHRAHAQLRIRLSHRAMKTND
jgi:RNA polymerase sigma factor (sigma-70 family)